MCGKQNPAPSKGPVLYPCPSLTSPIQLPLSLWSEDCPLCYLQEDPAGGGLSHSGPRGIPESGSLPPPPPQGPSECSVIVLSTLARATSSLPINNDPGNLLPHPLYLTGVIVSVMPLYFNLTPLL